MKPHKRSENFQSSQPQNKLWAVFTKTILIVMALMLVLTLLIKCNQQMTSTGPFRRVYEGKIVDKSATIGETELGSTVRFRLLVSTKSGEQLQVAIDRDNYERAQVGMWIKSSETGIQLSWDEPEQSPPAF